MRNMQDNVFSGTGVDTTQTSSVIDLREVYGWAVHYKATKNSGTVAGSFKAQVSCDGVNFIDLASYSDTITDTATNEASFNFDGCHYSHLKFVLTLTGGNIDFNTYFSTKG